MNNRNIKNSDLDLIGKKLVQQSVIPLAEIDNIVSNPELFRLVNERIARNEKRIPHRVFLFSFIRQNAVAAAGMAVVVTAALAAMTQFGYERIPIAANKAQVPVEKPDAARPDLPPQEETVGDNPSPGRAVNRRETEGQATYEKAVLRQMPASVPHKPRRAVTNEPDEDFYAVSYLGDPGEPTDGSRVIRVDMNRASLLAMGMNVALENDDTVVRADLLVGRDGVTRAIRIVK